MDDDDWERRAQNVRSIGIVTRPPFDRAAKIRSDWGPGFYVEDLAG